MTEVRKPIVGCLLELAHSDEKGRKVIVEAGFVGTLRRICEFSGAGIGGGGGGGGMGGAAGGAGGGVGANGGGGGGGGGTGVGTRGVLEDDRDVVEQARMTLDWLEHGDVYSS